jgi:hypothetical protein
LNQLNNQYNLNTRKLDAYKKNQFIEDMKRDDAKKRLLRELSRGNNKLSECNNNYFNHNRASRSRYSRGQQSRNSIALESGSSIAHTVDYASSIHNKSLHLYANRPMQSTTLSTYICNTSVRQSRDKSRDTASKDCNQH